MSTQRPTPEQIQATSPTASNWVGANAGSGKTHVLTQRVARLLLSGAEPNKILCLTYTKAAAAEMQSRLFRTLGEWAMASEDALATIIANISGEEDVAVAPDALASARRLFARALETPGGLKIQTIHAFCEAVLRRFPLEAGISPQFEVMDDLQRAALMGELREREAERARDGVNDGFDRAASRLNEGGIEDLGDAVLSHRDRIAEPDIAGRLQAHFGGVAQRTGLQVARDALNRLNWDEYAALKAVLEAHGGKTDKAVAAVLPLDAVARDTDPEGAVNRLTGAMLTQKFEERKNFPVKNVKATMPGAALDAERLSKWAYATQRELLAQRAAERSADLHAFGQPLLQGYEAAKAERGLLDFDDLISRTQALLDGEQRHWVLFKLDQGIDHILVDEAQDTSPAQWSVVKAIAEDFLSGGSSGERARTLFVVGDEKQSIYSFQGAEPSAFGQMREYFGEKLHNLGQGLGRPNLITSFRSAPAVLDYVDAVFAGDAATGLTVNGDSIRHRAHRDGQVGRVDLWPLVPSPEVPEAPDWWLPVDTVPPTDAKAELAERVAAHIQQLLDCEQLPGRGDSGPREILPEDILVLVSRRDRLARGIIQGLKARGVPVAGADRLELVSEIAVQDLLALIKVSVLRSDDLSLAAVLRSPLGDCDEEQLFQLAHNREGNLWQALAESEEHQETAAFLQDMSEQADFLRPYEFLERVLIRHDGRRRLLARLGAEAEDPIDELLAQALGYEQRHAPSLSGFVDWIENTGQVIKREMDRASGQVRVMTVHGAKGLEAPIVILPDTVSAPSTGAGGPKLLTTKPEDNAAPLILWASSKAEDDDVTADARDISDREAAEERKRLLYVALTRAEDWLILCGAEARRKIQGTWYDLLAAGMERCRPVLALPSPTGQGEMLRFETGMQATGKLEPTKASDECQITTPAWVCTAGRESQPARLSPSTLAPHEAEGGAGLGRAVALRRGEAVHAVLEHCSNSPDQPSAADFLTRMFPDLGPELATGIIDDCMSVWAMDSAPELFGSASASEVSVAIDSVTEDGRRMIGRIDRLVERSDDVWIVDFKSDASGGFDTVPAAYVTQLGAYVAALGNSFPGKRLRPFLLWTAAPKLEEIDAETSLAAYRKLSRNA